MSALRTLATYLRSWRYLDWAMVLIMLLAVVTRLWDFPHTVMFQGDQGRDAIVVKRLIKDADPILIGPVTSNGNMYLGPLYYYFMAPFLWITYPSPLGPAYAVAVLSILTVWLTVKLGKEVVGEKAAVVAAGLMAGSSLLSVAARASWNPFPSPFVALIGVWALARATRGRDWYFALTLAVGAVLMQLHYVYMLFFPPVALFWLVRCVQVWRFSPTIAAKKRGLLRLAASATLGMMILFASFVPQLYFDYRHDWLNVKAFQKFISSEDGSFTRTTTAEKLTRVGDETHGKGGHIISELFIGQYAYTGWLLSFFWAFALVFLVRLSPRDPDRIGVTVLATLVYIAILGVAFYRGSVFDHYILYIVPAVLLLWGWLSVQLWRQRWTGKTLLLLLLALFVFWNAPRFPRALGWTIDDVQRTSQSILAHVQPNESYNIVLLSESGDLDGQSYRYFLEASTHPPLSLEQRQSADTLIVINEDRKLKRVWDSPVYEIVVFPKDGPRDVYTVPGGPEITIFRRISIQGETQVPVQALFPVQIQPSSLPTPKE